MTIAESIYVDTSTPIDEKYGPYNSIQEACDRIDYDAEEPDFNKRYLGLTVGIIENGSIVEYWWKDGLTNSDLIVKQSGGSTTIVNEINDETKTMTTVAVSPKAVADFVKNEVDSYLGGVVTQLSNI